MEIWSYGNIRSISPHFEGPTRLREEPLGDGYRPLDRAEEHIRGAFSESSHDVNLHAPTDLPNPGSEEKNDCWDILHPCTGDRTTYCSVVGYYSDWLSCNSYESKDLNIIITEGRRDNGDAYDCGGETCGCGKYAHAMTGVHIAELSSSYETHGYLDQHNAMHTVLHEYGHSLLDGDNLSDCDGDGDTTHDYAETINRSNGWTVTALTNCDPGKMSTPENNCCNSVSDWDGWELEWSNCSETDWRDPF